MGLLAHAKAALLSVREEFYGAMGSVIGQIPRIFEVSRVGRELGSEVGKTRAFEGRRKK